MWERSVFVAPTVPLTPPTVPLTPPTVPLTLPPLLKTFCDDMKVGTLDNWSIFKELVWSGDEDFRGIWDTWQSGINQQLSSEHLL